MSGRKTQNLHRGLLPETTGQVTDSSGEPMIGVSVMVKGSNNGVVTNMDGKYEIKIDHLIKYFNTLFLGYLSQEKRIGDNRMLNVTLEEDVKNWMKWL